MTKVLIVVDMQNDFITGSLGTSEAQAAVPRVVDKVKRFNGEIFVTLDTHNDGYLETQEGKNLPVEHCVEGTVGHDLCPELLALDQIRNAKVFEKETFGSKELAVALSQRNDIKEIELVGLCTDICVVSNALMLKAFMPERKISVDSSCCAGVTPQSHQAALETMKSCQIEIR